MAITTNTTKSIKKTSSVLAPKCKATKENMAALAKKAGIKTPKMVATMIPRIPGSDDDVGFYLMRGESVEIPEELVELLKNTGNL